MKHTWKTLIPSWIRFLEGTPWTTVDSQTRVSVADHLVPGRKWIVEVFVIAHVAPFLRCFYGGGTLSETMFGVGFIGQRTSTSMTEAKISWRQPYTVLQMISDLMLWLIGLYAKQKQYESQSWEKWFTPPHFVTVFNEFLGNWHSDRSPSRE